MRIRYVAVSAAAVAVLGLAAGCNPGGSSSATGDHPKGAGASSAGGDSAGGNSLQTSLQQAYSKTTDAKTAKISMTGKVTGSGAGNGNMSMNGVVQFSPLAEQLTMTVAGQQIEAIMTGGYEYIKMGSSWRKIDLSTITTGSTQSQDPTQALAFLEGVSSSVTKLGTTSIRGVRATGYKATVDLKKAAEKQGASSQKALDAIAKSGVSTVPVEVWLDSDGRVVREHSTLSMNANGKPTSVDTTTDLYDYGTPVHITAPAGA